MNTLEQQLRIETQDLKELFLQKMEQSARNEFEYAKKVMERSVADWCKVFNLEPRLVYEGKYEYPYGFYNTRNSKILYDTTKKYRLMYWDGLDKLIKTTLHKANLHYETSLQKLVTRLIEKGLTDNNFEIVSKKLGVNFELVIKYDNNKTVRCWTIIAEGDIQRAHYRYLIK